MSREGIRFGKRAKNKKQYDTGEEGKINKKKKSKKQEGKTREIKIVNR